MSSNNRKPNTSSRENVKSNTSNSSNRSNNLSTSLKNARKSSKQKRRASMKIKKFMTNKVLKYICSDSGECLMFGRQTNTIRNYFKNFVNFDFVVPPIKRIGEPSANGFVNELKYVVGDYTSYAVLKSSSAEINDNLAYEYEVGQFINTQCKRFSCFLETYGLYYYISEGWWNYVKNQKTIDTEITNNVLIHQNSPEIDYAKACENSKHIAILIQHIRNAITLYQMIEKTNKTHNDIWNIIYILYQVYFPLCALGSTFTHYDLHVDNVLLYKLSSNKYIEYNYHFINGKKIVFYSEYIAKIIDYGRSYFFISNTKNSSEIAKELCNIPECNGSGGKNDHCGYESGFQWLYNVRNSSYIYSYMPNISFDLKLLKSLQIFDSSNELKNTSIFAKLFEKLIFLRHDGSGTPEKKSDSSGNINNIYDLLSILTDEIENNALPPPQSGEIIGKFDIYEEDRPMKYTRRST